MPNEFVAKNGLIAQNNSVVSGSLIVTNGITGSLFGTSSQAVSASFTATSSFGLNAISASYAFTASSASNSFSASFAQTSSFANNFTVANTLTAQTLVVSTISSSVVYSSGSNIFGNSLSNTQTFTGSVNITGSLTVDNRLTVTGSVTATGAIARSTNIAPRLVASANNDQLVGLDINPTFNTGSFTGISSLGAKISGSVFITEQSTTASLYLRKNIIDNNQLEMIRMESNGSAGIDYFKFLLGSSNARGGSIIFGENNGAVFPDSGLNFALNATTLYQGGNWPLNLQTNGSIRLTVFGGGNLAIGTTTDSGYKTYISGSGVSGSLNVNNRLYVSGSTVGVNTTGSGAYTFDVNGTTRFNGNSEITGSLTVVTGSGIEFQVTNTGVKIGNIITDTHTVTGSLNVSGSITGSLFGTASWATNFVTGSVTSASFAFTASSAISASFASTASFVNTLNQNVVITGSLTVGQTTTGAGENTLTLGPAPAGGAGEGGQLLLMAKSDGFTSASMLDVWQNQFRILRGTNASSDGLVAQWNLHSKQVQFPAYTGSGAFTGSAVANLAVDSSGNILTVATGSGGGSAFPFTGSAQITGSLGVTGSISASGAIISTANGTMYFRGGDDAELWDINVTNTVGVYGQQDQTVASIKLGSGGGTISGRSGNIGIGTITPNSASLHINGNVFATSFTGSLLGTATSASYAFTASSAISSSYAFTASSATTASTVIATVTGTNSTELVRGNMADNDQFRILVGGTATNTGFAEIATADDGTEPIHVRQYTGVFSSLVRTATLLDGSGNTSFPGTVSATFSGNLTGTASFASSYLGSGSISTRLTNLETASANLVTASGSFSTRVTNTETTASNLVAASASFSTRITSDSSSFSSRVSSIEATTASLQVASGSFSTRVTQIERTYATTGSNIYTGSQNILGAITASAALINGTLTAQTLVVTTVSSSVVFSSGSNIFGNSTANTQTFTGSVNITGSTVSLRDGSFSGSGANLYNIPASGITGLNLSQIATGSATASVGQSTSSFQVTSGSNTLMLLDNSGSLRIGSGSLTNPALSFATGSVGIYSSSPNRLDFVTAGSQRMAILNNGNVVMANASTSVIGNNFLDFTDNTTGFLTTTTTFSIVAGTGAAGTSRTIQRVFGATGNVAIQNGGTFTDAGFRLDVSGSTRITNNLTVSGSTQITGSVGVTGSLSVLGSITGSLSGSITGSLFGTSSQAVSSSYALTASFALNAGGGGFPFSGSAQITGSLGVTGSFSVSANQGSSVFSSNADTLLITGSLIITGSGAAITGSLNVSNGITGSLFGTASQAVTASYALTASFVASIAGLSTSQIATGSITASVSLGSGSFAVTSGSSTFLFVSSSGNVGINNVNPLSKLQISGDSSIDPTTNIYSQLEVVGSTNSARRLAIGYNTNSNYGLIQALENATNFRNLILNGLGGNVGIATQRPSASLDVSGSVRITNGLSETGSVNISGSVTVTGSITTNGTITAQTLVVQTVTSSIVYSSGSNIFGNALTDTQTMTGSVNITGSLTLRGNQTVFGVVTIQSASFDYGQNLSVSAGGYQVIASEATSSFRCAFFDYVMFSGSIVRAGTVTSTWSGSATEYYENYTADLGGNTSGVLLQTAISAGNIQLQASASTAAWTIRSLIRLL